MGWGSTVPHKHGALFLGGFRERVSFIEPKKREGGNRSFLAGRWGDFLTRLEGLIF